MLRKTILALATSVALGAAALAPSAASASPYGGWHGGWHHAGWHGGWHHAGWHGGWHRGGWHGGWYGYRPGYRVYASYGGCLVHRWFRTPHGPVLRWVNVCY
jgi:hypothetical protein